MAGQEQRWLRILYIPALRGACDELLLRLGRIELSVALMQGMREAFHKSLSIFQIMWEDPACYCSVLNTSLALANLPF